MTRRAVVLGAGVSGLTTARALSEGFDEVVVVDRDELPAEESLRAGIPQGRHTHVLIDGGGLALDRLFPGFCEELVRDGAVVVDPAYDGVAAWNGVFRPRFRLGVRLHSCTRPFLEHRLRKRLHALPNVRFLPQHEVASLIAAVGGIGGVRLRSRVDDALSELPASLVVDATGRESKAGTWLAQSGLALVDETVVQPHLGYASRLYRFSQPLDFRLLAMFNLAPNTRGGNMVEIEGGRWTVTLAGCNGDYPPTDEAEFMAFARSLPHPCFYDLLATGEPLTPIAGYRRTENRWRHYERMAVPVAGFLVVGDALCALNPFYGQGMTIAAMQADALVEIVRRGPAAELGNARFVRAAQRRMVKTAMSAWPGAVGLDMHFPKTEGPVLGMAARLQRALGDRILARTATDTNAARAFFPVIHLSGSPAALMRPSVLWGALRGPDPMKLLRDPPARPA